MLSALDLTGEEYHHTPGDVFLLRELAGSLPRPHPVLINIGACFGTSALALLEGNSSARIFSIDVRPCPEERQFCLAAVGQPWADHILRVLGRSQVVARGWPKQCPVDLVLVDGAHDYLSVIEDARLWGGLLRPGGWLLFHDCGTPSLPDVPRAVQEVLGRKPDRKVDTLWGYHL